MFLVVILLLMKMVFGLGSFSRVFGVLLVIRCRVGMLRVLWLWWICFWCLLLVLMVIVW